MHLATNPPTVAHPNPLTFPSQTDHRATIIFAHGFGETGDQWATIARLIHQDPRFRDTKIVIPTALPRKVTLYGEAQGRVENAWYDIVSSTLSPGRGDPFAEMFEPTWSDIDDRTKERDGIEDARVYFEGLIDAEKQLGIAPSDVFLGGFSQGGCIALYTAVSGTASFAGAFALSAYMPLVESVPARRRGECGRSPALFLGNGSADPSVKWSWGRRTYYATRALGFVSLFRTYRGLHHFECVEEFEHLLDWITLVRNGSPPKGEVETVVSSLKNFPASLPKNIFSL